MVLNKDIKRDNQRGYKERQDMWMGLLSFLNKGFSSSNPLLFKRINAKFSKLLAGALVTTTKNISF